MNDEGGTSISSMRRHGSLRQWLEVAAVIMIAVVPDLFGAVVSLIEPATWDVSFALDSAMLIQRSVSVCSVVLLLMWLSGDQWRQYGIVPWSWKVDPILGMLLLLVGWVATMAAYLFSAAVIPAETTPHVSFSQPDGKPQILLLLMMCLANGFAEELVIWSFLFTRLRPLVNSPGLAIFLCAALFASYHVYQGPSAMVAVFAIGVGHGVFFWLLRRLWPLVVAHTVWDFLAYMWWM